MLIIANLQEAVDLFEDEVIRGGPAALPGAVDLLSKVLFQTSSFQPSRAALTLESAFFPSFEPIKVDDCDFRQGNLFLQMRHTVTYSRNN